MKGLSKMSETKVYPVILHHNPTGDYSATVPDVPGAYAQSKTKEQTISMVKDAIGLILEQQEQPLPTTSSLKTIKTKSDDAKLLIHFNLHEFHQRQHIYQKARLIFSKH